MKAVIADDEPVLTDQLRKQLQELWPELEVCAVAANGEQALNLIRQHQPDVAFLDIKMPGHSGMEVAAQVNGFCHVVFITAYEKYAVQAFEQNAVDYLLKPVNQARLEATVTRLKKKLTQNVKTVDYEELIEQIKAAYPVNKDYLKWVKASSGETVYLVNIEDIIVFHADAKYTSVITREKEYFIKTPLKELERNLDPDQFWRVHRGSIINVGYIENINRSLDGRYMIKLAHVDGKMSVSRSYAHLFKQM